MKMSRHQPCRHISWNGISLEVPRNWQVTPSDLCHLTIESDFQAVMELRWQAMAEKSFAETVASAIEQYEEHAQLSLLAGNPPAAAEALPGDAMADYELRSYRVEGKEAIDIIFLHHRPSSTFILVQCYPLLDRALLWQTLATLQLRGSARESLLWAIQDFQVRIPGGYAMTHFKMDAGFTVLCFRHGRTLLHVLRLAPADVRLRKNSMEQICATLLGLSDSRQLVEGPDSRWLEYTRSPGIIRQIRWRMKRRNPFHRARFWHNRDKNRLQGIFLESTAPISEDTFAGLCAEYEIVSG